MSGWGFTGARVEVFSIEGNADGRDRLDYLSRRRERCEQSERRGWERSGMVWSSSDGGELRADGGQRCSTFFVIPGRYV